MEAVQKTKNLSKNLSISPTSIVEKRKNVKNIYKFITKNLALIMEAKFAVTKKEKRLIKDKNKKINKGFIFIFPRIRNNRIEKVNRYSAGAGSMKTKPLRKITKNITETNIFTKKELFRSFLSKCKDPFFILLFFLQSIYSCLFINLWAINLLIYLVIETKTLITKATKLIYPFLQK